MTPDYTQIPAATLKALQAWIERAHPVNEFCEAVLANDLREAFARADAANARAMFHVVSWLFNRAPQNSWGSRENYENWPKVIAQRRKAGTST